MRIDCYGNQTEEETFVRRERPAPLETKFSGDWTYQRYTEGDRVAVHRLGVGPDGIVAETWAYGKWAEAETLDYIPLERTREVDA